MEAQLKEIRPAYMKLIKELSTIRRKKVDIVGKVFSLSIRRFLRFFRRKGEKWCTLGLFEEEIMGVFELGSSLPRDFVAFFSISL